MSSNRRPLRTQNQRDTNSVTLFSDHHSPNTKRFLLSSRCAIILRAIALWRINGHPDLLIVVARHHRRHRRDTFPRGSLATTSNVLLRLSLSDVSDQLCGGAEKPNPNGRRFVKCVKCTKCSQANRIKKNHPSVRRSAND